jgi:hypothetical protein
LTASTSNPRVTLALVVLVALLIGANFTALNSRSTTRRRYF